MTSPLGSSRLFLPTISTLAYTLQAIAAGLILLGSVLRLIPFLTNRPLWLDEVLLANNVIARSMSQLVLEPLDSGQAAPPGFLLAVKALNAWLGESEASLRVLPLLFGLLSLPLFYRLAGRVLPDHLAIVSLALFAVSPYLIYYSSEFKPYSADVFFTLLILLIATPVKSCSSDRHFSIISGIVGALAVWFSFVSLFVLAGVTPVLTAGCLRSRDRRALARLSIASVLWAVSLAVCYVTSLSAIRRNSYLTDYWGHAFMPMPPRSLEDLRWFSSSFLVGLSYPGGLLPEVAGVCFLLGIISLCGARRSALAMLVAPLGLALMASGLQLYPFSGRLLLFGVPSLLLIVTAGADYLKYTSRALGRWLRMLAVLLIGLYPVLGTAELLSGRSVHLQYADMRSIVGCVIARHESGDLVYTHFLAQPGFAYYSARADLQTRHFGGKSDDWELTIADLEGLRGERRVWVVLSQLEGTAGDLGQRLPAYLDARAVRINSCTSYGAAAYLYDLAEPPLQQ